MEESPYSDLGYVERYPGCPTTDGTDSVSGARRFSSLVATSRAVPTICSTNSPGLAEEVDLGRTTHSDGCLLLLLTISNIRLLSRDMCLRFPLCDLEVHVFVMHSFLRGFRYTNRHEPTYSSAHDERGPR